MKRWNRYLYNNFSQGNLPHTVQAYALCTDEKTIEWSAHPLKNISCAVFYVLRNNKSTFKDFLSYFFKHEHTLTPWFFVLIYVEGRPRAWVYTNLNRSTTQKKNHQKFSKAGSIEVGYMSSKSALFSNEILNRAFLKSQLACDRKLKRQHNVQNNF